MGGRLGDFLHAMFAVKSICEQNNIKADVYMYDIGWEFGIENTYAELKPLLLQQNYINSLNILENYELDPTQEPNHNTPIRVLDKKLLKEGYIDLGDYIRSPWLYKACWSELYSNTFNFEIKKDHRWILHNGIDESFNGKVIIHRKNNPRMFNPNFPYKEIINRCKLEDVIFASSNQKDYDNFPYKQTIPFYKVTTLEEWFTIINSCGLYIGNLTGITVMAHAMDKLRIIELPHTMDALHCMGEERYTNNISWLY